MKKKTLLTVLQYVIFLGLGIGIIYWMFSKMTAEQIDIMLGSIKQTRAWYLVPIFIVGFLSHYFRALRWKLMLEPMYIRPTTTNTFFAVMVGYITNLVLPRAGEVAKCTVLARYEKVPADKMIGTIVAERAFDVVCLGLLTFLAFVLEADVIGKMLSDTFGGFAGKTSFLLIILGIAAIGIITLVFLYRRFKDTKIGQFIGGLMQGVMSILQLKKRGMFLLYTALIWGSYWFLVVLGFWSMPPTENLSLATALVVLIVGSVGIIATPGGIGAYPALVASALSVYGVDAKTHGQAFGWVSWSVQMGIVVILGVLSIILLPIINNKQKDAEASVDTK
ncbi:MAG: flippase-like domain-containing protein [Chitinophagales bacterium]|nr:flippase-like domain-containing protein [Chitinophagales bacterium]